MRRGRVYYAKLAGGRSMFVAPRLISHFAAGVSSKCSGANTDWPQRAYALPTQDPESKQ